MNAVRKLCLALLFSAAATAAQAIVVQGDVVNVAGIHWTAKFQVINDGSLPEVSSFTIYFEWQNASNLQLAANPATWDTLVIQPDSALASDGLMDALVIDPADALVQWSMVSGFEVSFDWLANSPLTGLRYTINDPASYAVLESGTVPVAGVPAIPEPGSLALVALGLWVAAVSRPKRRCD